MTKLICISFHRYVGYFFILALVVSAVTYLTMVNIVYSRVQVRSGKLDIPSDYTSFEKDNELHKQNLDNITRSSRRFKNSVQKRNVKLILLWNALFEDWSFLKVGKDSFKESACPETRCEITDDRRRLLESDAVLFHIRTLSMLDLPKNRTREQKWIFFSLEAPPYSRFQGFGFMSKMFNWTMTYRKDSDIYIPYGRIISQDRKTFDFSDLYVKWKNKSKMAVWMVSHCLTASNREVYVDQLKTYIDVDIYGSCGIGTCPFNKTNLCVNNFSKQYYFFLAFENSICEDYITEKLFRTFQYDMIPVVFGGGNYSAVAPPNSFIDTLRFQSVKQLSSHLLKVVSNFTLFSQYFKWRDTGYSEDIPNHCEICQKMHSKDFEKYSVYPDISEWWITKANCMTWKRGHLTVE